MVPRIHRVVAMVAVLAALLLGCSSEQKDKDGKRDEAVRSDKDHSKGQGRRVEENPEHERAARMDKGWYPETNGKKAEDAGKPDFTLTGKEFIREFLKDKKAAGKKYDNKVVRLTGEVRGVRAKDAGKSVAVQLEGFKQSAEDPIGTWVEFDLAPEFTGTGLELSGGQKIEITGKFEIWLSYFARLERGVLKELGRSEAVKIAASDLAKDVAAAPNTTKYAGKVIIVAGELVDVTKDKQRDTTYFARLKGDGKAQVMVILGDESGRLLKKGQSVRLRAVTTYPLFENNEVRLHQGYVVEIK